ncbi:hypothetical protein PHYPO_G00103720 [Pangasianodon hypophthalmus]|uniref:Uncharacterized protein n=1 Tax=Pangasianodon hypophthalmus TaxID=310915 RepID=A0A5N5PYP7_PANHP|nr:hypothetical protein PHYPO_G00103720 [Pangasianodon hypophthalmus]
MEMAFSASPASTRRHPKHEKLSRVVCSNTARRASRASASIQPFLYTGVVQKKNNNKNKKPWIYKRLLEINGCSPELLVYV